MLHPLKSFTTFECDGCAHHASFHSLENKFEDEIQKRWEMEQRQKEVEARENEAAARPKKRVRQIERAEPVTRVGRLMIESAAEHTQGGAEEDGAASDVASTSTVEQTPVTARRGNRRLLSTIGRGGLSRVSPRRRVKATNAVGRGGVLEDLDVVLVD